MYADDKKHKSIHLSQWPFPRKEKIDEENEKLGDLIMATIGEIRRDKAERKKPLNSPIKKLTIYAGNKKNAQILNQAEEDIAGTCKAEKIETTRVKGKGREVEGYPDVHFSAQY